MYLQVEELQAVQLVEEVVGESGQLAVMHMQALQLLQAPECPAFQSLQRVIAQIKLLQHPEVTEGSALDPCDVIAVQPKHLCRRWRKPGDETSKGSKKTRGKPKRQYFYLRLKAKGVRAKLCDAVVLQEDALRVVGDAGWDYGEVL